MLLTARAVSGTIQIARQKIKLNVIFKIKSGADRMKRAFAEACTHSNEAAAADATVLHFSHSQLATLF